MTPEEKAKELVESFMAKIIFSINQNIEASVIEAAKQCALIAVDEILKCHIWKYNSVEPYKYWQEVKKEIEKL